MKKSLTSYDILHLEPSASQEDINSAYRRLAKSWHPDFYQGANKERANHNFKLLQQAYQNVKTPEARSRYHQHLARQNHAIIVDQNKVMNDNRPLRSFLDALNKVFGPTDTPKG